MAASLEPPARPDAVQRPYRKEDDLFPAVSLVRPTAPYRRSTPLTDRRGYVDMLQTLWNAFLTGLRETPAGFFRPVTLLFKALAEGVGSPRDGAR